MNNRDSPQYKQFVKAVFERDKYKCTICNSKKRLNAHHLDAWHWNPIGRHDPNNAVTLCSFCHNSFHRMFGRKNNTRMQFEKFKYFQKQAVSKRKKR